MERSSVESREGSRVVSIATRREQGRMRYHGERMSRGPLHWWSRGAAEEPQSMRLERKPTDEGWGVGPTRIGSEGRIWVSNQI